MILFTSPDHATPLDDCSGLIPEWIQTQDDLNRAEAENILHAQLKYLYKRISNPLRWFNPPYLQQIHRMMFGSVWTWAGKFRKSNTSIGIKPYLIPTQLADLSVEVQSWCRETVMLSTLEQSARIHHKLVWIHPFENGNGRFSRLVADRYLLAKRCKHPIWPAHLQNNGEARLQYIKSLKAADQGDYSPLLALMVAWGAQA